MKINLLETSAVGIPAYPDAHFNFIKAAHKATDEVIAERGSEKMSETVVKEEIPAQQVDKSNSEPIEKSVEEVELEEVSEEPEEGEFEEESESEEESTEKNIDELIAKAVKEAFDKITTERGFVEKQAETKVEKSFAELCKEAWSTAKRI